MGFAVSDYGSCAIGSGQKFPRSFWFERYSQVPSLDTVARIEVEIAILASNKERFDICWIQTPMEIIGVEKSEFQYLFKNTLRREDV